jgi:hypothetical protein
MRRASVIEFEGVKFTLSLLPWGVLKRAIKGRLAKTMMGVPFVPRYELAVWTASVLQPDLVCYFPDEHSAMEGFAKVEAAIKQDGLANPWNILMEDQTRLYLAPFCRLGKMQEDTIRGHRDAFKELEERQVKLDDAYATMIEAEKAFDAIIEAEGSYPRARSARLGDDAEQSRRRAYEARRTGARHGAP